MNKMKKQNKIKLAILAFAAILCTGIAGFGVYSASNETVKGTLNNNAQFVADGSVDATIKVKINGAEVKTVTFTSELESDNVQTESFRNIVEEDWLEIEKAGYVSDKDRHAVISFEVTNVARTDKDVTPFTITVTDPASITDVTTTKTTAYTGAEVMPGETVVFSYDYYVTGLKDIPLTAQSYAFTLLDTKALSSYEG